jgi:hypothetical protein
MERISEEPQEMLEKERYYVPVQHDEPLFMKDLHWASVDEKGQCALGAAKRKLASVFREDRRQPFRYAPERPMTGKGWISVTREQSSSYMLLKQAQFTFKAS